MSSDPQIPRASIFIPRPLVLRGVSANRAANRTAVSPRAAFAFCVWAHVHSNLAQDRILLGPRLSNMPGSANKGSFKMGEEDCDLAACKSMMDILGRVKIAAERTAAEESTAVKSNTANPQGDAEAVPGVERVVEGGSEGFLAWRRQHCPLTREALGDATWAVLHSTAAYFPDEPSPAEQTSARGLIEGVASLYPCTHCREDFKEAIKQDPPKVDSREAFAVWVCQQHNLVNEKLGKPTFSCDLSSLDMRWRVGEKKCWVEPVSEAQTPSEKR